MELAIFLLLLLLSLVVLVVVALMRARQLSSDMVNLRNEFDGLRNSLLVNAQLTRDLANEATSAPAEAPADDLQTLLENPLVQQFMESR